MIALVLLACFISLVSSTIVQPTSEPALPSSPDPDVEESPQPFPLTPALPLEAPKPPVVPTPQFLTFVKPPSPSPEPDTTLLITCRDGSCRGDGRMFSCSDENGSVRPRRGRATLLLTREVSRFQIDSQYRATVPSLFIDWGFLWFIPWRSTKNDVNGGVSCGEVMAFGTPFGFSPRSGSCCNACSFARRRSGPPSLLCCGRC